MKKITKNTFFFFQHKRSDIFWMWISAQREHLLCQPEPWRQHPAHLLGSHFFTNLYKTLSAQPSHNAKSRMYRRKKCGGDKTDGVWQIHDPGCTHTHTHTHSHTPNKEPANQGAAETQDSTKFVFLYFISRLTSPPVNRPLFQLARLAPAPDFSHSFIPAVFHKYK